MHTGKRIHRGQKGGNNVRIGSNLWQIEAEAERGRIYHKSRPSVAQTKL